jgi:hypothetical protein
MLIFIRETRISGHFILGYLKSMFTTFYNCGSGSAWIRVDLALLDPDLFWESGSASRSMEIGKIKNETWIPSFQKRLLYLLYEFVDMFFGLLPTLSKFYLCNNSTFCDQDQDPDL